MKITRTVAAASILLLVLDQSTKADLIETNTPNFGQNSLTLDTGTGLGWLNVSFSTGLSYDQVSAETQPGGTFSGFRFATSQEVLGLFYSAGISHTGQYMASNPEILSLISLIGSTSAEDGHPEVIGISGTSYDGGHVVSAIDFYYLSGFPTYGVTGVPGQTVIYGETTSFPTVGSWLVTVPEPTTISLIVGAGLILLGRRKLHRSHGRSDGA